MKAVKGICRHHGLPEATGHKEPAKLAISNKLMTLLLSAWLVLIDVYSYGVAS